MADWDADDFEPQVPRGTAGDKWDGEDEDDIKDSWEDDDDDEKKKDSGSGSDSTVKAYQKKKKKPLAERIAEKEAARAAAEKAEKDQSKDLTAEEKLAEKLRLRKIQEDADLKLAKDAFGVSDVKGIEGMFPDTEEEFVQFKDALKSKITQFDKSTHYSVFLEKLFQELLMEVNIEDLKRITTCLSGIFHEKQRQQKELDKKKKKKNKIAIRAERDDDYGDLAAAAGGGDDFYDDDCI